MTSIDNPRIHVFGSSREAYDAAQCREEIHDGDVLHVPSEGVIGFLYQAWPIALTPERGAFHGTDLDDPANLGEQGKYAASVALARELIDREMPETRTPEPSSDNADRSIADRLQAIADDIESRLNDENRDRQIICEDTYRALREVVVDLRESERPLRCGACLAPLPGSHKRDCPFLVDIQLRTR